MNTPHYKDLEVDSSKPGKQRLKWGRWLALAVLTLILLFAALVWLGRKYIAQQALAQWCHEQSLECQATFESLGPGGAMLTDVRIRSGGETPFAADEVIADLEWSGFVPSLGGVSVVAPQLRGTLDDRGLRFYGLESVGGSGSGGGGALPPVKVSAGRVSLATSAGDIGASIDLEGEFPTSGTLQMRLDPVSLSGPEGTLVWSEGRVDVVAQDGQLEGDIFLDLQQAEIRGVQAREVQLEAILNSPISGEGRTQFVWDGTISSASWTGYEVTDAETNGQAIFAQLPSADLNSVLDALIQLSAEGMVGKVSGSAFAGRDVAAELDLNGEAGRVSGPFLAVANAFELPQGRGDTATVRGQLRRTADAGIGIEAEITTAGVALNSGTSGQLTDLISLPDIFSAHEASLKDALRRAMVGFDASLAVDAQRDGTGWSMSATGPAQVTSRTGLALDIEPAETAWFTQQGQSRSFDAKLAMRGGGFPNVETALSLRTTENGLNEIHARDVKLAPWRAGDRSLSADLSSFDLLRSGEEALTLEAEGKIGIAGNVSGFDLASTHVTGHLIVSSSDDGWRIATTERSCLQLDSEGVRFGSVQLGAFQTPICPEGNEFIKPGEAFAGSTTLGDISVPIAFSSNTGSVSFTNAEIDWTGGKTASVSAIADALSLSLNIGEQSLTIDGQTLRLGLATRSNAPPALSARLGATKFDGSLIPADVSSTDFRFDGTTGESGVKGGLSADGVMIRDYRADPLYQPLTADLDATLNGPDFYMTGPLKLSSNGITVADTLLRLDIATLTGMAAVNSRDLTFEPGGLQPWRLSDRLRGVFTDARGDLVASARLEIEGGKIGGTADVTVSEFGFQTTRLGRVQGVNGQVTFSDVIALTTEPGQVISVERLNPGVPLESGKITFQLVNGNQFNVESASFPFAGGTLALSPLNWSLAGEQQTVEVTANGIELSKLVEVLKLPDTRATGTVSGSFPINVEGTDIFVRDARLKADEEGGYISYQGTAADSAGAADPNAKMAFEALQDFDFTVLELGLDGNVRDRMTISLILEGQSRKGIAYGNGNQVLNGQPFLFDITVNSALGELLRNAQYYTSQKSLTDEVVKQVTAKRLEEGERE